ncbi:hydrogenase-4 component G [Campylobacter sp. 9BO]|uniref:hydrogenase-4 component G n=1 Tax=Campylobacter sp. 9BO TaxID=3424759 RepID=UPI003D32EE2A
MNVSLNQVKGIAGYTNLNQAGQKTEQKDMAESIKQMASNIDVKSLTNSYFMQYNSEIFSQTTSNFSAQSSLFDLASGHTPQNLAEILGGIDLNAIGYTGKPLVSLSQDEAAELVSEKGFFGVDQTTERIAGFVLAGAGDNLEKLQAGREGMLRGFKEAEKIWGGELPEISQKTMQKALEAVDKKIAELGGNVLNVTA